jgi:hypothetical protein
MQTSARDLIFGYEEITAPKMINGGNFFSANDYLIQPATTPILNDHIGAVADASYGLFTGSNLLN